MVITSLIQKLHLHKVCLTDVLMQYVIKPQYVFKTQEIREVSLNFLRILRLFRHIGDWFYLQLLEDCLVNMYITSCLLQRSFSFWNDREIIKVFSVLIISSHLSLCSHTIDMGSTLSRMQSWNWFKWLIWSFGVRTIVAGMVFTMERSTSTIRLLFLQWQFRF